MLFKLVEKNGKVHKKPIDKKPDGNMMCFTDSNGDKIFVEE